MIGSLFYFIPKIQNIYLIANVFIEELYGHFPINSYQIITTNYIYQSFFEHLHNN